MELKLTIKQKAFADYYLETGNATQAAKRAGYSEKTAYRIGADNLKKTHVAAYIAERQGKVEATRLVSLEDIQAFRLRVMKGEEKDAFGMDAALTDRLKAANDLEKALKIKEEQEAKEKAMEEARNAKCYHMDLDIVADVFHPMMRDIRRGKHSEYILPGGRGSTKSSAISCIINELIKNNHDMHALVLRKVGNTIKDSVYAQIKWAIKTMDLEEQFEYKLSPIEIVYKPTGQKIFFRGADDPLKIKSIKPEFGYIGILWFEELDQFAGPKKSVILSSRQSVAATLRISLSHLTRPEAKTIGRMNMWQKPNLQKRMPWYSIVHIRMYLRNGWERNSWMMPST